MKTVTLTLTFAGCLDGCPHAEGADRIMSPSRYALLKEKQQGVPRF